MKSIHSLVEPIKFTYFLINFSSLEDFKRTKLSKSAEIVSYIEDELSEDPDWWSKVGVVKVEGYFTESKMLPRSKYYKIGNYHPGYTFYEVVMINNLLFEEEQDALILSFKRDKKLTKLLVEI